MNAIAQELLNHNQNWTLVGILGVVLVSVIGLLVWIVKWLCTRFATSIDRQTEVSENTTAVVGESTQTLARVGQHLERLQDSHEEMRRSVESIPSRFADELQRRKL